MQVLPVKTPLIKPKEDLVETLLKAIRKQRLEFMENDIVALASKIVSFAEGRLAKLSAVKPSQRAKLLAKRYMLTPAFAELILREADRVVGGVAKAVLTLNHDVFTVNAGIDNKNAPEGFAILWPANPQKSAERIRKELTLHTKKKIGVLILDSTVAPLRMGTRGLAIGVAGFEPVKDYRRTRDLFEKEIVMTIHNVADDLASAAHSVMGESVERTPVVIIRNAPVTFADKVDAESMKIAFKNCVYMGSLKPRRRSIS
ncbi:MAG TPA: coenzyme F420-0:L-glutamate ligase [Candidatus Krumholzibacteriaceae bacterium]|jgi:coenzyme F420-0:L-glutamate ligase|nr:coenzyme F420-0:L-glutamate ligase [Candidatus Krumholzibacteriaceae bacterium]